MKNQREDNTPITDWIPPENTFEVQDHDWTQRGYEISCSSCPIKHGSYIPVGKMLTGKRGEWRIVDETISR